MVNTCTVTNIADRKSRQMLHRAKAKNPAALVVAAGCYVDTDRETLLKDAAVDVLISNAEKKQFREVLEACLHEKNGGSADAPACAAEEEPGLLHVPGRMRADIKIEDGCNQFCTYCIIPYARGRVTSRPEEEILREAQGLAAAGVPELVLSGIHISSYGKDRGEEPAQALLSLMNRLHSLEGIHRIRLSSLEPRIITEAFVQGLTAMPKFCPHFHLSLQSGCDATLRRMHRQYTTKEYRTGVDLLRKAFQDPAVTTDVITGFPGETEEEFAQTKAFLEETAFYEMHVFPYSMRRGTVAATMPDQVPGPVKTARSRELLALTAKQAAEYRAGFLGREEEILAEEVVLRHGKRYLTGHTTRYVKGMIPLSGEGEEPAPGMLVRGTFREALPGTDALLFLPRV